MASETDVRKTKLPPYVQAMLSESFYAKTPTRAPRLVQTHISYVVLTGHTAYKIKKDVNMGFLDFSTLELRKLYCEREVELNQRTADGYYRGVTPIVIEAGEYKLGEERTSYSPEEIPPSSYTVEWCVTMNEFDQAWLLNNRLESGDVTLETITNLAKTIATYHKGCDRDARIADWGRAEIVKRAFDQNYFQTARFIGSLLSQQQFDECKRFSDGFFSQPDSQKWLEERRATGFIRRCHGDLHPRNVVIEPNGKIVLFDCIEFSEEFSCVDTMYDIAFLLVGLLAKAQYRSCVQFIFTYMDYTCDYRGLQVLPLYMFRQAYVKAKVLSFQSEDICEAEETRLSLSKGAQMYYSLATRFALARNAQLLGSSAICCGVSGTGKSYISRELAAALLANQTRNPFPAVSIRSDAIRKHLAGIDLDSKAPNEVYSESWNDKTYGEVERLGIELLRQGWNVIFDAKYDVKQRRLSLRQKLADCGISSRILHCFAPKPILQERLRNRGKKDISDATEALLDAQLASFEEFGTDEPVIHIDTSQDMAEDITRVAKWMISPS